MSLSRRQFLMGATAVAAVAALPAAKLIKGKLGHWAGFKFEEGVGFRWVEHDEAMMYAPSPDLPAKIIVAFKQEYPPKGWTLIDRQSNGVIVCYKTHDVVYAA